MQERKHPGEGDVAGPSHGDPSERLRAGFSDWDNPEDEEDEWDDDEHDEVSLFPGDPDYDLSEEAGYAGREPPPRRGLLPEWLIVAISLLLILAILTPVLIQLD